ncbi:hypothetical protein [Mastigocladopsis repens]|nr:hypothetical protein [Mastigocladopsis repens]
MITAASKKAMLPKGAAQGAIAAAYRICKLRNTAWYSSITTVR